MDHADTIVAPITPPGRGAVAIVRLSGDRAHDIAHALCPAAGEAMRHAYYTPIAGVDDGLCTLFAANASYTGEAVAEISCHGSPHLVARVVEEAVRLGARFARPGEFTERAFLNGVIDLTRAEAVRDAIESATAAQARRAATVRSGALFDEVARMEAAIGKVLANIEAVVDFSEEIGDLNRDDALDTLRTASNDLRHLISQVPYARLLRQGLRVALIGRPNVGKSSLLNALLGQQRAIVTDIPGTTRDTIEEAVSIAGYPVVLTDTAGLRETDNTVEALGVERSRAAVESADDVWLVYEAHVGVTDEDRAIAKAVKRDVVWVANKSDLGTTDFDALQVSALAPGGTQPLIDWITRRFAEGNEVPLANERHEPDLAAALSSLGQAMDTLQNSSIPVDIASVDLYAALERLGRITGRTAPDEVLEQVFRDFCIGK